jgi:hypothetical protein
MITTAIHLGRKSELLGDAKRAPITLRGGPPTRASSFEKALRDTIENRPYTMVCINVMTL